MINRYLRGGRVQLTDEDKPSGRRDGLCSCKSVSSNNEKRNCYGELTWFAVRIQEYFDRRIPGSSLNEVSEIAHISMHGSKGLGAAYRRVLNTTSTMTAKKLSARSACCDLLKGRNITSMVLH